MKKIFCAILLLTITLTACGRKGPLDLPEEKQKRPKFDKISDEMPKPVKYPLTNN